MIKLLIFFPFLSFLAVSENKTYKVEELCVYDEYCRYSFDDTGKTYPVKPEVRFVLANLHSEIVAAGKQYGIDPRAIAGSISAENTLNVQMDDSLQEYLAQNGVTSIAGKSFTFGLGQLNPDTAMIGEAVIAKIDGRSPRSRHEVEQAMLNPVESIKLISGVIRHAQDIYKEKGIDISGRPDLLATLYNLGNPESRVTQASAENPPRPNYFGAFVANNITDLQDTIGWSPEKGKYQPPHLNSNNYAMNRLNRRSDPLNLYSRPPTCSAEEVSTRQADVVRGRSFNGFRQTGQIVDEFTIVDQTIDCEMKRWVLVQTPQGKNGWVKHYDLEQNAKLDESTWRFDWFAERRQKKTCENSIKECDAKIAQITGTSTTRTDSLMTVIVNAAEGVTAPSIKDFYTECYDNQIQSQTTGGQQSQTSQRNRYPSGVQQLNGILLRQMREKLKNRKKEVISQLGLRNWNEVPEDFRKVFEEMERQLNDSAPRADSYSSEVLLSVVNTQIFEQVLKLAPATAPAPQAHTPSNNGGPKYFGDMSGYQGQRQQTNSYGRGSQYRDILDELNYNWRYDQTYLRFKGAASAPNITEIRQPLGPASAPRGIQAQEVSEMVYSRNETRRELRELTTQCKKYPDTGFFTLGEIPKLLSGPYAEDISNYIGDYAKRIRRNCEFFDTLTSGGDISNTRYCDSGGCEIHYLDPTTSPPELRRDYFPMDYVQKNKHLLNPREVIKAMGARYKTDILQNFSGLPGAPTVSGSGSGCSYDPLKTLEKIEELSKLECVGSIFVPEGDLFDGAERKSIPKVSFRPMETNDSYQLLFKSCPIDGYKEPVVETDTPRPTSNAQ